SELVGEYHQLFQKYSELDAQISEYDERARSASRRSAELEFVVEELGSLNLQPGLRSTLEAEVGRLANAERLINAAQLVVDQLVESDGVGEKFSEIASELSEIAALDGGMNECRERFEGVRIELDDIARTLRSYAESIELDQAGLEVAREKLAELARIERKYRTDSAGLIQIAKEAEEELEGLRIQPKQEALRKELDQILQNLMALGMSLRNRRLKSAKLLVKSVIAELKELNMAGAVIEVQHQETGPGSHGLDRLALLGSMNKGEDPKPLNRIASGGELARLMLVLKKVLRDRSGVNVLVFDEVDSGISGAVARAVGDKLKSLAEESQVICITHLAQVASLADRHFLVDKVVGKRTISVIRELQGEQKVEEIARMLAGYQITSASRESARELLSSNS
ncbi:MAG: hypothetical protein KDD42_07930, partial [Bdellovibrionales bacterium]|nr:hypothetical protein [Bdellovibrionales bacterium]